VKKHEKCRLKERERERERERETVAIFYSVIFGLLNY